MRLKVCPDKSLNKAFAEQERSINRQLTPDKQARVFINNSLINIVKSVEFAMFTQHIPFNVNAGGKKYFYVSFPLKICSPIC